MNQPQTNEPASVPEPESTGARRGRRQLILLFVLFLTPVVAAVLLNSRWTDWQPQPTRNYGELIQPVVPITALTPAQDPGVWHLLLPVSDACGPQCLGRIAELQRVKRTLGRHEEELEIVLVTSGKSLSEIPEVASWVDSAGLFAATLKQQGLANEGLFLVDPLGNLMMQFSPPVDDTRLSKDLDRLVSHSRFE